MCILGKILDWFGSDVVVGQVFASTDTVGCMQNQVNSARQFGTFWKEKKRKNTKILLGSLIADDNNVYWNK